MFENDFDEVARNIGLRVLEMRKSRGLTQQELADRVPVDVGKISRVELGKQNNLTVATLVKLSNALGVRVVDLFSTPKVPRKKASRGRPRL